MTAFKKGSARQQVIRWTLVVYAITFGINWLMYFFRSNDFVFFLLGGYGMMWVPGIIAIMFATPGKRRLELGLKWAKPRYFFLALIVPVLVHVLLVLISVLMKHPLAPEALVSESGGFRAGSIATPFFLSKDAHGWMLVAIIAANQSLLVILACMERLTRTLGEELGWRGWLDAKLVEAGLGGSTIWGGLIWGFWHAPLILMGHNFPENPTLGAWVLMPALSVGLAFPLAWLRRKSDSVWPAALFHASVNATSSLALGWLGTKSLPTSMVVLWLLVGGAFAVFMPRKKELSQASHDAVTL